MGKVIDIRKARAALARAAAGKNQADQIASKANRPRIKSSMMTDIDYDDERRELDVTFVGGKTYRYREVPPDVYDRLLNADSKGAFFNEHIKDKFDYREIASRTR